MQTKAHFRIVLLEVLSIVKLNYLHLNNCQLKKLKNNWKIILVCVSPKNDSIVSGQLWSAKKYPNGFIIFLLLQISNVWRRL